MPDIRWNQETWTQHAQSFSSSRSDSVHYGDQWGDPEKSPRLQEFRDGFILPHVKKDRTILEIGPGGGRWTQYLLGAAKVYASDINEVMFSLLSRRFPEQTNLEFILSSGTDYPGIPTESLDFVFSLGVFVHIDPLDIFYILKNLRDLMKVGATGVIQFSDHNKELARKNEGFARNNPDLMRCLVEAHGFSVVDINEDLLKNSSVIQFEKI